MHHDDCLDDDIRTPVHEQLHILAPLSQQLDHTGETPFMTSVVALICTLKGIIELVDRVVGQVHKHVVLGVSLAGWFLVRFCGEAGQAFFEEVDHQRIQPIDQHIQSEVKLQTIDQIGSSDILLRHIVLQLFDLLQTPGYEDTSSLAVGGWLEDVIFLALAGARVKVLDKLVLLAWQEPSLGKEVVLFREH